MTNWLRKIMPKEEAFFPLFVAHAEKVAEAAAGLRAELGEPGRQGSSGGELDGLVSQGAEASRTILERIRGSFVTPFDRTDIKAMTGELQRALDEMGAFARLRRSLGTGEAAPDLAPFGDLIATCAQELKQGTELLSEVDEHAEELRGMRQRIADARERARSLRDEATVRILQGGAEDPTAALAGLEMLARVSAIVERLDAVADGIDDLVLDHA